MCRDQALGNLGGIVNRLASRHGTIEQAFAQGLPFQQLRNDVGCAIVHADVIDGNNVGMTQSGSGAGLLLKTAQAVLIVGKRRFEYFEGYVPSQPLVAGTVNFPHTPKTDLLQNSIMTQYFPNHHAMLKRRSDGMLGRGQAGCQLRRE